MLRLLVQTSARTSDVSSDTLMAIASALKNVPVTPVIVMSGRNTTIGVSVEPISGTVSSLSALAVACSGPSPLSRCSTMFSTTTILSSITRPTAAARPPSVIRLKLWPSIFIAMNVTTIVTGHDEPGHHRGAPVAQEEPDDQSRQEQADDDRVADAADRLLDDVRLVVERSHLDAGRQRRPDRGHLLVHFVGDLHGVAVRLAVDAQEQRRACRSR